MRYACSACAATYDLFALACPGCGRWRTIARRTDGHRPSAVVPIAEVASSGDARRSSGIPALDALLGGGFVPGSATLLVGPPGAGKSTLLLELVRGMEGRTLYATGEESLRQVKLRADRLGVAPPGLFLTEATNVRTVAAQARDAGAGLLAIDSLQTVHTDERRGAPGSPSQMRACAAFLRAAAQGTGLVLLLVGQVTKEGTLAGPRAVEHAVDVVLRAECGASGARALSAVKNRFGPAERSCRYAIGERGIAFDVP